MQTLALFAAMGGQCTYNVGVWIIYLWALYKDDVSPALCERPRPPPDGAARVPSDLPAAHLCLFLRSPRLPPARLRVLALGRGHVHRGGVRDVQRNARHHRFGELPPYSGPFC